MWGYGTGLSFPIMAARDFEMGKYIGMILKN